MSTELEYDLIDIRLPTVARHIKLGPSLIEYCGLSMALNLAPGFLKFLRAEGYSIPVYLFVIPQFLGIVELGILYYTLRIFP